MQRDDYAACSHMLRAELRRRHALIYAMLSTCRFRLRMRLYSRRRCLRERAAAARRVLRAYAPQVFSVLLCCRAEYALRCAGSARSFRHAALLLLIRAPLHAPPCHAIYSASFTCVFAAPRAVYACCQRRREIRRRAARRCAVRGGMSAYARRDYSAPLFSAACRRFFHVCC